jgi:hypothetical protein
MTHLIKNYLFRAQSKNLRIKKVKQDFYADRSMVQKGKPSENRFIAIWHERGSDVDLMYVDLSETGDWEGSGSASEGRNRCILQVHDNHRVDTKERHLKDKHQCVQEPQKLARTSHST